MSMSLPETALAGTGVTAGSTVHANLMAAGLVEHALRRGEGRLSADGAFMAVTGVHTGRSVQDKFVVDDPEVHSAIWWGKVNQPMAPERFRGLAAKVRAWLGARPVLFTQDLYAGADPAHRIRVRLVTTNAWHALFARNMFIRPPRAELAEFVPRDYVHQPAAGGAGRVRARLHHPARARVRGRPGGRWLPQQHLHRPLLRREDHPDRRHQLCRRDQEEHLHGHELAAAGAR